MMLETSKKMVELTQGTLRAGMNIAPNGPFLAPIAPRLHFKGLVTISGHLSDKIFIASHFIENTITHWRNIAHRLYFQKIVGLPIAGRLKMGFSGPYVSKNTPKSPISHDKIPCPTSHNDIFCLNDGHLGVILDLLPLHIPRRT